MVKKEIDAGILQQLKDNGIAFLPYVSGAEVRAQLRVDIQALQVPEWSNTNYHVLLPAVVAEIWRSYLERTISVARQAERIKRLETELELERLRNSQSNSIFSTSEERDFEYITQTLDRTARVAIEETVVTKDAEGRRQESYPVHEFDVNLSSFVPLLSTANDANYSEYKLGERLVGYLMPNLKADERGTRGYRTVTLSVDLADNLLTFGLLVRLPNPPPYTDRSGMVAMIRDPYRLEFTDKMQRYRYWLRYNGRYPERLQALPISKSAESLAAKSG